MREVIPSFFPSISPFSPLSPCLFLLSIMHTMEKLSIATFLFLSLSSPAPCHLHPPFLFHSYSLSFSPSRMECLPIHLSLHPLSLSCLLSLLDAKKLLLCSERNSSTIFHSFSTTSIFPFSLSCFSPSTAISLVSLSSLILTSFPLLSLFHENIICSWKRILPMLLCLLFSTFSLFSLPFFSPSIPLSVTHILPCLPLSRIGFFIRERVLILSLQPLSPTLLSPTQKKFS